MSSAQRKALEAIRDGRITYARDMGWFQRGGYRTSGTGVRADVVARVVGVGWAKHQWRGLEPRTHADVVLTDMGREALES